LICAQQVTQPPRWRDRVERPAQQHHLHGRFPAAKKPQRATQIVVQHRVQLGQQLPRRQAEIVTQHEEQEQRTLTQRTHSQAAGLSHN
jgi:hypothetical protein